MNNELQPLPQLFQDKYSMACHSDDMCPWFKVNDHWIRFTALDLYRHPLISDEEYHKILTEEYDKETAKEILLIAEEYWNDR